MGTRDFKQEGGPYVWKSWKQVHSISKQLAKSIFHLGLAPEVHAEDRVWRFMGIYSKNREEWILTELAGISQGVTTVSLYDTLGPDSVEFVIN